MCAESLPKIKDVRIQFHARFLEAGAKVMICDIKVPSDRAKFCANIDSVVCDVRDKESVKKAFEATKKRFGSVDVVVNNDGVIREAKFKGK